jgi:FAD:protein FMN transferase
MIFDGKRFARRAWGILSASLLACGQARSPEAVPSASREPILPPRTTASAVPAPKAQSSIDLHIDAQLGGALDEDNVPGFVPERIWGEGKAMGTHIRFACYTRPKVSAARAREAFAAAIREFERLENLMTTWRDSEIFRVNAASGSAFVPLSEDSYRVVDASMKMSEKSKGAFDITFETLHGLWKFDEDLDPNPPSPESIKARLVHVGYKKLKLDPIKRSVMIESPQTKIGLGGIAKGYAVDQAARVLLASGLRSFLVQAGGDLISRGYKPDGSEWSSGIRDPRGPSTKFFATLQFSDRAFSTAGDYERAYIRDGKRYHHILDPRTGYPAALSRSVTVWAKTAFEADAIDDAVFVLGPEKGLELVDSIPDVGAVIVDANNKVWVSERLKGKVVVLAPPTDAL